jgi:2-oxoglutarate ferredoxin oxidoreductase subunit beta
MQVSPTTPSGMRTNTTPRGAWLRPLNPLTVTLGITNASFVAQVVEWMPDVLYDVIKKAFHHRGFAFIRILQRCPHFMADRFDALLSDPNKMLLLEHEDGIEVDDALGKIYKNHETHDPSNLHRAREVAETEDMVPIGILYRKESIPRYEELVRPRLAPTWELRKQVLEQAFNRFAISTNQPAATHG